MRIEDSRGDQMVVLVPLWTEWVMERIFYPES